MHKQAILASEHQQMLPSSVSQVSNSKIHCSVEDCSKIERQLAPAVTNAGTYHSVFFLPISLCSGPACGLPSLPFLFPIFSSQNKFSVFKSLSQAPEVTHANKLI